MQNMTDMKKIYVGRRGWNEADVEHTTPLKDERGASVRGINALNDKLYDKNEAKKGLIPLFFATDNNVIVSFNR